MRAIHWFIGCALCIAGIGSAAAASLETQDLDNAAPHSDDRQCQPARQQRQRGGDALGLNRDCPSASNSENSSGTSNNGNDHSGGGSCTDCQPVGRTWAGNRCCLDQSSKHLASCRTLVAVAAGSFGTCADCRLAVAARVVRLPAGASAGSRTATPVAPARPRCSSPARSFHALAGAVLDDYWRLLIAMQACLPALQQGAASLRGWREILIYPGEFKVRRSHHDDRTGVVTEGDETRMARRGNTVARWCCRWPMCNWIWSSRGTATTWSCTRWRTNSTCSTAHPMACHRWSTFHGDAGSSNSNWLMTGSSAHAGRQPRQPDRSLRHGKRQRIFRRGQRTALLATGAVARGGTGDRRFTGSVLRSLAGRGPRAARLLSFALTVRTKRLSSPPDSR